MLNIPQMIRRITEEEAIKYFITNRIIIYIGSQAYDLTEATSAEVYRFIKQKLKQPEIEYAQKRD